MTEDEAFSEVTKQKGKKRRSTPTLKKITTSDSGLTVKKIELQIPKIVIPMLLKKKARNAGPSPWNGTISYTNKI